MDTNRLQELAGVPLTEAAPKTTKDNPLVITWDSAKSVGYPEQGISGHMHLSTAAKIYKFPTDGVADQLWKLKAGDDNDRIKAGSIYLSMSEHTEAGITSEK